MKTILFTVVIALIISFLLGFLLGLFKKIFAVKTDPKIQEVRDALSGANCGGCGFAGCDAFAQAVVQGTAPTNGCVAGGPAVAAKVAELMGASGGDSTPKAAFLACNGSKDCAQDKGNYNGVQTCGAVQMVMNGSKKCSFGCIGLGDCVNVCPFGALSLADNGLPIVDYKLCVGCGKCVKTCPKHLFSLINLNTKGSIARCSNHSENKPQIRKDCSVGCFKCGLCAKKCPSGAIDVSSGIPVVDYTKCNSCGECIKGCPDKVLILAQDIIK